MAEFHFAEFIQGSDVNKKKSIKSLQFHFGWHNYILQNSLHLAKKYGDYVLLRFFFHKIPVPECIITKIRILNFPHIISPYYYFLEFSSKCVSVDQ